MTLDHFALVLNLIFYHCQLTLISGINVVKSGLSTARAQLTLTVLYRINYVYRI